MSSATAPGETGPAFSPGGMTFAGQLATAAWGLAVAAGLVSIVVGVAIVVWPKETIGVIAVLFGLELLVQGVYRVAQALVAEAGGGTRGLYAMLGVLCFAVGVLALRHLLQTAAVLAILFGLFWLIEGVIELVNAVSDRARPGWGGRLGIAILSMLAGVLVLAFPAISLTALVWIVGIWLIAWGVLTVLATLMIRRLDKRAGATA